MSEVKPMSTSNEVAVMRLALEALRNHSGNYKLSKAECVEYRAVEKALEIALSEREALNHCEDNLDMVKQSTKCVEQSVSVGEPAPVAKNENGSIKWLIDDWPQSCLLYTHTTPYVLCSCGTATGRQQRTWVGLMDADMTECIVQTCNTDDGTGDTRDLIRAVEAKLREKNSL